MGKVRFQNLPPGEHPVGQTTRLLAVLFVFLPPPSGLFTRGGTFGSPPDFGSTDLGVFGKKPSA